MIRLADYVIRRLEEEGVRQIFYVPGRQCFFLTDALRKNDAIHPIAMHHEQSVAMAALSDALYSNRLGAGVVTTGCAGTNTMTGLLHAWQDSLPMIIVSGQQEYAQTIKASGHPFRQVGIQEADIETLVKPITKYAVTVDDPKMIAFHMDKAIHMALTGRKGPVWIDIPFDYQNTMINEEELKRYTPEIEIKSIDTDKIQRIKEKLLKAKRPVVLAGNGVRSADAGNVLRQFAERHRIPVTFTRFAYDLMSYEHELNYGVFSVAAGGSRYANFIVQNADFVLAIGTRLSIDTVGGLPEQFAREAHIAVIDIDEEEHQKGTGISIDTLVIGDAKECLNMLEAMGGAPDTAEWLNKCKHWKEVFGYKSENAYKENAIDFKVFVRDLSLASKGSVCYISDAGITGAGSPAATVLKVGDRFIHSFAQGEMGYAIPGACGAAAVHDGPVIAFVGDGSFMMNLQELQTIKRNNYNIKIVIINNHGYSGVRHGQQAYFRGKTIGTCPEDGVDFPDFEKIAVAFGFTYLRAEDEMSVKTCIQALFADEEPCICEAICDPEQTDLRSGMVICGKRSVGTRPPEDLYPYIDRDVFFEEMIVEPLEESSGRPI